MTRFQKEFWWFVGVFITTLVILILLKWITGNGYGWMALRFIVVYLTFRVGWNFGYDEGLKDKLNSYYTGFKVGIRYNLELVRNFMLSIGKRELYKLFLEYAAAASSPDEDNDESIKDKKNEA
jgi:hypothetical protein